jgi:hypothetical protein
MECKMNILKGFLFLILVSVSISALSLEDWTISDNGGLRLYYPNDIRQGQVFMYVASGPYDLHGADLKQWFSGQAQQMQNQLGKPLMKWDFKAADDAWKKHIIFHDDGRFEMSAFSMQSNSSVGGGNTGLPATPMSSVEMLVEVSPRSAKTVRRTQGVMR